jgi:very-short-patch-repair endonuclease
MVGLAAMANVDRRVGRLAAENHSLITLPQLCGAGLTKTQVDHRVRQQRLDVVYRGVYRMPGVRPTYESDVLAACLATGGAASHRCAARLFDLRGFARSTVVEVAVDARRSPRLPGVVGHRLDGMEHTRIGVIPVVMPAEVLLGVAAVAPTLAEGALNDALVKRLVSLPGLVRFLNRRAARGRDGTAHLRRLVEEQVRAGGPTESWLEDRVVEFLRRQGFPEATRRHWVRLPGARFRLDAAYPERLVDIEADSRLWHTSPGDRRRDAARDARLKAAGWTVVRITWLELVEEPDAVAARLATALRQPPHQLVA